MVTDKFTTRGCVFMHDSPQVGKLLFYWELFCLYSTNWSNTKRYVLYIVTVSQKFWNIFIFDFLLQRTVCSSWSSGTTHRWLQSCTHVLELSVYPLVENLAHTRNQLSDSCDFLVICFGVFINRVGVLHAIVRVWFVRLYGKIIHERQRVDYRPYRRTNHTLTSLLHLYASAPCALRDIWC